MVHHPVPPLLEPTPLLQEYGFVVLVLLGLQQLVGLLQRCAAAGGATAPPAAAWGGTWVLGTLSFAVA